MQTLFNLVLRVALFAMGLVFAASLLVVAGAVLALWGVRSTWARLTGRPIAPFVFRVDPRAGFGRVYRAGQGTSAAQQPDAARQARTELGDVTDVEVKVPRG